MTINYYRHPNGEGERESWENCQFDSNTDLSSLTVKHLVTINGQPFLRQHHLTYLTGKETCHAHHFAKLLATKLLATPATTSKSNCKVLWIDTLHGPHVCAKIYYELVAHATDKENLHFICLDILGSQRQNFYAINRNIEHLIKQYDPELVVIDDIDHFMPFCGVNTANEFCHIIRDAINHSETAFLCIGYNHLGKKASTTGNLGKYLFLDATDVFGLSTQGNVTTVRLVNSYDMSCLPDDSQFRFTIGTDNLPHEASTVKKDTTPTENSTSTVTSSTICSNKASEPRDRVDVCSDGVAASPSKISPSGRGVDVSLLPKGNTTSINNSLTLPPLPKGSPCCGIATAPATTMP